MDDKKLSPPTVSIVATWNLNIRFLIDFYQDPRAIFLNFHLFSEIWRHEFGSLNFDYLAIRNRILMKFGSPEAEMDQI